MAAMRRAASFPMPKILPPRNNPEEDARQRMNNRPPGRRAADGAIAPLYKPPAKPDAPRRRRPRPLGGALARRWPGAARFRGSLLVPPGPSPGSLVVRGGSPHMGRPPDPPFEEGAALNGRPEGGRRAPRPGADPPKFAARERGRCRPGARCCPCCFSGSGLVPIVRAPRARPAPRARGALAFAGAGPPPPAARGP